MKYLRLFETQSEYQVYLDSSDIWVPRVTFIRNAGDDHTSDNIHDDNGPSYVDFDRFGKFIEIDNDGTMYFTDQVINGVTYHAEIANNQLVITSTKMVDGSIVYTNDASIIDNQINIITSQ